MTISEEEPRRESDEEGNQGTIQESKEEIQNKQDLMEDIEFYEQLDRRL